MSNSQVPSWEQINERIVLVRGLAGLDVDETLRANMAAQLGLDLDFHSTEETERERLPVNYVRLERLGYELLETLGQDASREGLKDTPRRWASMWREFIEYDAGTTDTSFQTTQVDQIVIVAGIRVWSMCEHHLLPFWCDVTVGYIPNGEVLGLSKFARIAHKHAHKLQLQEQLVGDIIGELEAMLHTDDIAVIARGQHLCMSMRGVRSDAIMTTSTLRGAFKNDAATRAEFLQLSASAARLG